MGPGGLKDGEESGDIGVHIGRGLVEAVADPGLGGEVDDAVGPDLGDQGHHAVAVDEVEVDVAVVGLGLEAGQSRLFQGDVVVAD